MKHRKVGAIRPEHGLLIGVAAAPTICERLSIVFGTAACGIDPAITTLWDRHRTEASAKVRKRVHDRTTFIPLISPNLPVAFGPKTKGNPYKIQPLIWFTAPSEDTELVN